MAGSVNDNHGRRGESMTQVMVANKAKLIKAVEEFGGNMKAIKAANISYRTYANWMKDDPEFKENLEKARVAFGESMLEEAIDRIKNPEKGKGSDVLLIAILNAYMSHVFKPTTVVGEDTAKELITEWRKAARADARNKVENPLPEKMEDTLDDILSKKQ